MVKVVERTTIPERLKHIFRSPLLNFTIILIVALVTVPLVYYFSSLTHDIRSRAAGTPTATISVNPSTGNFAVGQQFTVDVVIDGGGQAFNAAEATVIVSSKFTVNSLSLVSPSAGGCNFTFINGSSTPSATDPSFAGAILNGSSTMCTLYTLTLTANALGSGSVAFTNSSVKAYEGNSEILVSATDGAYSVTSLTPVPTTAASPTPAAPNSDLIMSPPVGSVTLGSTFTVQLRVNTNGQLTNAFQSDITYPTALLDVVSVDNIGSAYEIQAVNTATPGSGVISLASGSITPKSGNLLLNTITFRAKSTGVAQVRYVNPIVASSVTNTDVLKSFGTGDYTISSASTPTPTSAPTATPTTQPLPTGSSSPTPTNAVTIQLPGIDLRPVATYNPAFTLTGTKSPVVTSVLVNNSATNVTLPNSTTWQYVGVLTQGTNSFSVVGRDAGGNTSGVNAISISLHKLGDINGDNSIDLADVSMFGTDWKNVGTLNHILSDMNDDGAINLTDFSIIAKAYGN